MELTPQALHDVEFREARRGGYNTRDVDDFLERVAIGVGQLQDRLREAYHRAEAAEARLVDMQRQLDDVQRRGPEGPSDADETLRRTLVLAQRTADATIKEAKDEADRVLTDAQDEAARVRASAESDARRDARVEIEQLAGTRDELLSDIENLELHLDKERASIRRGLEKLRDLLDEPTTLSMSDAPSVSEASAPPALSPAPSLAPEPPLPSNGRMAQAANGSSTPPEPSPREHDGSMVAALQELPRREPREPREPLVDPVPPTEPVSVPSFDPPPFETPSYEKPAAFDSTPASSSYDNAASFDPPAFETPSYETPSYDTPAFDTPSFEKPATPFDPPAFETPAASFDPPSFEKPAAPFDPPAFEKPAASFDPPAFETPAASFDPPSFEKPAASFDKPTAFDNPALEKPAGFETPSFDPPPGGPTGFFPDLRAAFDPPGSRPEQPPSSSSSDPNAVDDLPLPIDAPPPPPPPPGLEHLNDVGGIPIEPGSRPSEWGRGVFDTEEDGTPNRFGRR